MPYNSIVVGTDGSPSAMLAVRRAADIAKSDAAALTLVCAYHPVSRRDQAMLNPALPDTRFYEVIGREPARAALEDAERVVAEAGVDRVAGALVDDDAGDAVLATAESTDADLIVVGNRGINTLSGRLLGSVATYVSRRARCDVLVVHTTPGTQSDDDAQPASQDVDSMAGKLRQSVKNAGEGVGNLTRKVLPGHRATGDPRPDGEGSVGG